MRMRALIGYTAFAISIVSIAPSAAEQKAQPYFKDGVINFDREKYKKDFEQHERSAANPGAPVRGRGVQYACLPAPARTARRAPGRMRERCPRRGERGVANPAPDARGEPGAHPERFYDPRASTMRARKERQLRRVAARIRGSQAGSCCVMQCSVPRPSTRSPAWMPTTGRDGKSPARTASASRSRTSLKVGTRTAAFAT